MSCGRFGAGVAANELQGRRLGMKVQQQAGEDG